MRSAHSVRLLWLLVVALAAPPAAWAAQAPREDLDTVLARAVELHQAGDILGAIQDYESVLARAPERFDVRSNLGAAYARLGRYDEAIGQYRQALAGDPESAAVRFNLGLALYKAGRMSEAAGELSAVLARDPANKNALLLLADSYREMGEDKKVVELLTPYEGKLGGDRGFAYLFGTALIHQDQLDRGQVYIDRLMREGDTTAHVLLGSAHLGVGDHPAALKELKQAVDRSPTLPTVHSLYGRALLGVGDREAAARAFRRELELNPNDFVANLHLGLLRKNDRQYEEALAYLGRALAMRGHDPSVRYSLGSLYVSTGKVEEARQVLEELAKEVPQFLEAHVLLATVYYRLKRKEDGDREQAIVRKLNAEVQAKAPGAREGLGPAYRGEEFPKTQQPPPPEGQRP